MNMTRKGIIVCEHDKERYHCKECKYLGEGGEGICNHDRQRYKCIECRGGGICQHGKQKYLCKDCGGGGICDDHGIALNTCNECNRRRFHRRICDHGLAINSCIHCYNR